jgi:hypothetical protein
MDKLIKLSLFLAVILFSGVNEAGATAADVQAVQTTNVLNNGAVATVNPTSGAMVVQQIDPRCRPGGFMFEALNINTAFGYTQSKANTESLFAVTEGAIPMPAAAYNCLQRILNMVRSLSLLSWPPQWSAIVMAIINQYLNRMIDLACRRLWETLGNTRALSAYNNIMNGYENVAGCVNNLQACQPFNAKINQILNTNHNGQGLW